MAMSEFQHMTTSFFTTRLFKSLQDSLLSNHKDGSNINDCFHCIYSQPPTDGYPDFLTIIPRNLLTPVHKLNMTPYTSIVSRDVQLYNVHLKKK